MRVVHVVPTAFGAGGLFGGGERYPLELARALASGRAWPGGTRPVECELVTFGPRPQVVREDTGLTVRVLRPWARLHGHPAHPLAPGVATAIGGADVVHVHQLRSAPGRLAAVVARARGRRLVTTDHGLGGGGWGGLLPRLPHRFLTVSRYSADVLGVPPAKTTVIYGGVSADRLSLHDAGERAGVLFVGRLTPHKGVDRLLRALPGGAELTIVGTTGHDPHAPERDYPSLLRRLARNRPVRFVEAATDEEVAGLYRRSAVAVLPSVEHTCYGRQVAISELLGLSLIEAMAAGTPVIASRLGGLPEVVDDGETGFLVTPGDVGELADRLTLLLSHPDRAREMGRRGQEVVAERFTWDAAARRCLGAYTEVLDS